MENPIAFELSCQKCRRNVELHLIVLKETTHFPLSLLLRNSLNLSQVLRNEIPFFAFHRGPNGLEIEVRVLSTVVDPVEFVQEKELVVGEGKHADELNHVLAAVLRQRGHDELSFF